MTNNTSCIKTDIKVNGLKLETVTSLKHLGSAITDEGAKPEILCRIAQTTAEGSKSEILSRIAQTTAALTRMKPVWIEKSISDLQDTTVALPVTSIFLYACESWTFTAELQRSIQAMEMRCCRKILHISYEDHVTNEEVHAKNPAGN